TDVDSAFHHPWDRSNSRGKIQVSRRTVGHVATSSSHNIDFSIIQVNAMSQYGSSVDQTNGIQIDYFPQTCSFHNDTLFLFTFRSMRVNMRTMLSGKVSR